MAVGLPGGGANRVMRTARPQAGDRTRTFRCRQTMASRPPRGTPRQSTRKSDRQWERNASCMAAVASAGGGAAADGGAATAGPCGSVVLTTRRQAGDRPPTFLCRQTSASRPPGGTFEQCAM